MKTNYGRILKKAATLSYVLGIASLLVGILLSVINLPARAASPLTENASEEMFQQAQTCTPPPDWGQTRRLHHAYTTQVEWIFEVEEPEMDVSLEFFYYQDYDPQGCPFDCATGRCQIYERGEGLTPFGSFLIDDGVEEPRRDTLTQQGRLSQGTYTASFWVTDRGSINIGLKVHKLSVPTATPTYTSTPTETGVPVATETPTPALTATPTVTPVPPTETPVDIPLTATSTLPASPTDPPSTGTPTEIVQPPATLTPVPPTAPPTATPTDVILTPQRTPTPTPTGTIISPPGTPAITPTDIILPPAQTQTPTPRATLPPPSAGSPTPSGLIPQTGADLSNQGDSANHRLFLNLGIGLVGLAFVLSRVGNRLKG